MRYASGRHLLLSSLMALLLAAGLPAPAHSRDQTAAKPQTSGPFRVSAIQIQQVQSDEVKLPAEFQMALYENVLEQVNKTNRFQHVYRDGDLKAADAPDLVILHSNVIGFKQGSARARQVTTVAGATSITVHVDITDKSGKSLFASDVNGRVRFFGENLRATRDFAKKVASVVRQNFMPSSPAPK